MDSDLIPRAEGEEETNLHGEGSDKEEDSDDDVFEVKGQEDSDDELVIEDGSDDEMNLVRQVTLQSRLGVDV